MIPFVEIMKAPSPVNSIRHLALAAGALLSSSQSLSAATWDGGAGTLKWQDGLNWSTDAVPSGTEAAFVNTSAAVVYDSATGFTTSGQLQIGAASGVTTSVTLNSPAATLQFGGDGFGSSALIGGNGGSGTLAITSGKVQIGTGLAGNDASVRLGTAGTTGSGTLTISGGEFQVGRRILMGANATGMNATLTLSGTGLLNMAATGSNGEGDLGMVRLGNGTNTLNFDGGEFRGRGIRQDGAGATSNLYYNGTQFTLNGNSGTGAAAFIGSGGSAANQIKNGGLTINTNGFDAVIARGLTNFAGHTGVLTKSGLGKLTFSAGGSSYSETVVNGGTVDFTASDVFGNHTGSTHKLTINAGAVVTNSTGAGGFVTFRGVVLNGGELRATNTLSAIGTGRFQAYGIKGTVTVGGTTASLISDVGQANGHINLGGTTDLGGGIGANAVFDVADVTGDAAADLVVSAKFQNHANAGLGEIFTGFDKTGAGIMQLSGINRYTGATNVLQGTLALTGSGSIATSTTLNVSAGAVLDVSGTSTPWELATSQTLTGNGTVLGAATIAGTLAIGSSPGTMTFGNDLTLAGSSTSIFELSLASLVAGSFDLAQGGVGNQSVTFGGILNLVFNSAETYADGSLVKIFDFETYDGDFSTVNFSGLGVGQSATFDPASGTVSLSAVPEPSGALTGCLSLLILLHRRRRPCVR